MSAEKRLQLQGEFRRLNKEMREIRSAIIMTEAEAMALVLSHEATIERCNSELLKRCACEFVDGVCTEPCNYHSTAIAGVESQTTNNPEVGELVQWFVDCARWLVENAGLPPKWIEVANSEAIRRILEEATNNQKEPVVGRISTRVNTTEDRVTTTEDLALLLEQIAGQVRKTGSLLRDFEVAISRDTELGFKNGLMANVPSKWVGVEIKGSVLA